MWRELVAQLFDDAQCERPAEPSAIASLESSLGLQLPDDLRSLLLETDGCRGHYSTDLVWSAAQMEAENDLFRTDADFKELYMPFDCLLLFGGDGSGDLFGYRVLNGKIAPTSWIFRWCHESDDRTWFAFNVKDYLQRCAPKAEE